MIDQTSTGIPPGMAATTRFGGKAQTLLKDFSKEARENFESRNRAHAKIDEARIKTSFGIVLLTTDEATKLVESGGGWKGFHDTYPNSGLTLVSLPGIDSSNSHALEYVGASCDILCGGGYLVFLNKEDGVWKVANEVNIWLS